MRARKVWALLGDASYSVYLTHVFTLPYCYRSFKRPQLAEPTPLNIALVPSFSTVASAIMGLLVFRVVDNLTLGKMATLWRRRGVHCLPRSA